MQHITTRLVALIAAAGLCACTDAALPDTPFAAPVSTALSINDAPPAADSWLVRFSGGVPAGFADQVAALGGTVVFAHGGAGIGAVAGLSPDAAARLGALSGVRAVVPDETTVLSPVGEVVEAEVSADAASAGEPGTATLFPRQWHLKAIGAPAAWAAGHRGSPAVKVAILDTGLDYTHPDLAGRVDLASSRSFVATDDPYRHQYFPGALPFADLHYHGTHVGATVSSNGVVAAGVTSNLTLVALKVCNLNGRCPASGLVAGLVYAADLGVHVANMSIGSTFERRDSTAAALAGPAFVAIINDAFNYAHRKGTTVVVAAGNAGADMDHDGNAFRTYCGAATVICVSATGPAASTSAEGPYTAIDTPSWYTNYGRSAVSVAAPGGYQQPVWAACSRFSLLVTRCRTTTVAIGLNGTSMATPHVAGVAALIAGQVGRDPARIRARLQQTADDLGEPGTDPYYGKGRVNAARAVGAM